MIQVNAQIDGMMCGMCEAHIKDAIRKKYPNAKRLSADHISDEAKFQLEESLPRHMVEHDLKAEFGELGYKLTGLTVSEVEAGTGGILQKISNIFK